MQDGVRGAPQRDCRHECRLSFVVVQHEKAFNNNIVVFGQLADQFKLSTNQARQQQTMDWSFSEDVTRQLNVFTKGVAELSEKLENKTLELSRTSGRRACSSVTPPTADSLSSPQIEIPCDLEYIPGAKFKSSLLIVDFGINGDVSLTPSTARAKALTELGLMKMSPKGLVTILNQDLPAILGRCTTHNGFTQHSMPAPVVILKLRGSIRHLGT